MTSSNDPSVPASSLTLGPDDPRALVASAVALAGVTIDGIEPEQFSAPTPCGSYDVRALVGHLVGVLRRAAVVGDGGDPMAVPEVVDGVADEAWLEAWRSAAHAVRAAWTDDARLAAEFDLRWAVLSGADALVMWAGEITIHTWDLAMATGQSPEWDDRVVGAGLASIQRLLPAEGRTEAFDALWEQLPPELQARPKPFAAAVILPDDAPLVDRLVAWSGRRPAGAAAADAA